MARPRKPPAKPPPPKPTVPAAAEGEEQNLAQQYPTATLASVSGAVGVFFVWVLNRFAGTNLTAVDGAAIAGGFSAVMLLLREWKGA